MSDLGRAVSQSIPRPSRRLYPANWCHRSALVRFCKTYLQSGNISLLHFGIADKVFLNDQHPASGTTPLITSTGYGQVLQFHTCQPALFKGRAAWNVTVQPLRRQVYCTHIAVCTLVRSNTATNVAWCIHPYVWIRAVRNIYRTQWFFFDFFDDHRLLSAFLPPFAKTFSSYNWQTTLQTEFGCLVLHKFANLGVA